MDKKTALKAAAGAAAVAGAAAGIKAAIDHLSDDGKETSGTSTGNDGVALADAEHHHVVPQDEGWALRKAGAERATKRFETKKAAVAAAREMMQKVAPAVLVIHRADGTIQTQHTYGGD